MRRACAACTLFCDDPIQEACEACGTPLPAALGGSDASGAEHFLVPSSDTESAGSQRSAGSRRPRAPGAPEGPVEEAPRARSSSPEAPAEKRLRASEAPEGPAEMPGASEAGPAAIPAPGASASSSRGPGAAAGRGTRGAAIAADFAAARGLLLSSGGLPCQILGLELDEEEETVSFQLEGSDGGFNLFVAESYPSGESQVYGPDDWELRCPGTLGSVLERVAQAYGARRARNGPGTAAGAEEDPDCASDEDCPSPSSDASQHILDELPMEPQLQSDILAARLYLGDDTVNCIQQADSWRIRMVVALVDGDVDGRSSPEPLLDETTARAWGVSADRPIHLEMQVPVRGYLLSQSMPRTVVTAAWQEGGARAFQLEKQLLQVLADFCDTTLLRRACPGCHGGDADLTAEERVQITSYARKKEALKHWALRNSGEGFFVHVARYLRLRLVTAHEYCTICDQPFSAPPMFMRTVCTRQLCAYQFMEFGERITTAEGMNAQAEITDLLFCMFARAANSPRSNLIVDPYPCCSNTTGTDLLFDPRNKDLKKVAKTVAELKKVRDSSAASIGAGWTAQTLQMTPAGHALLKWIVSSNRSYLAPILETVRIRAFSTPFQYLLISAPPDRERRFQELKIQYGSKFAYHGSGTENWHSILRNGLRNCSSTGYQVNGAAYGAGVYLSPDSHLSLNYSLRGAAPTARPAAPPRPGTAESKPIGNRFLNCMDELFMLAVCEVISHPSLTKHRNNTIWVMPQEEMVMTRFFIVFTDGQIGDNIPVATVEAELLSCMEKLRVGLGAQRRSAEAEPHTPA